MKKKILKAFSTSTSHPFHLSLFRQRGNRQLPILGLILLSLIFAYQMPGFLEAEWGGFRLRFFANVFTALASCSFLWSAIWMRTRRIKVTQHSIVLILPFGRIHIPWTNVRDVEPVAFSSLYPIDDVSIPQRQRLGRLYKRTGLQLRLKTADLGWKRWLIPWPMIGNDPRTIFLLVQNWSQLAKTIPDISNGRILNRPIPKTISRSMQVPTQVDSKIKNADKQSADLLLITSGNHLTNDLITHLRQKHQLYVARNSMEAVKITRTVYPTLVLIDLQLLDTVETLGLIQTLK